jgi:hypothetical protein
MKNLFVAFVVCFVSSSVSSFAADFCGFEKAMDSRPGLQSVIADFNDRPTMADLAKAERKLRKIAPGAIIREVKISEEGALLTVVLDGKVVIPKKFATRDDGAPLGGRKK